MFENILTKESVSFKNLEKIAFKITCEFANEILRNMLEEYDNKFYEIIIKRYEQNKKVRYALNKKFTLLSYHYFNTFIKVEKENELYFL